VADQIGPRCGNNPNARLTDGDRQAVAEFQAFLDERAAARSDERPQCPDREPLLEVQCSKKVGHEGPHSDRPGRIWYPVAEEA
jgi:hypothetical protein